MKYSTSLLSLLFLGAASAHPNAARREALATRGQKAAFDLTERKEHKKGMRLQKDAFGNKLTTGGPGGYAGATFFSGDITSASATITVPDISVPPGAVSGDTYSLGSWVGIQSGGALWQAGITANAMVGQDTQYGLFWEYVGNLPEQTFSNAFSFGAGDVLSVNVTITGTYSGTATIINTNTQETASVTKTGFSTNLGYKSVNFVVEDPGVSGGSSPFAAWSGAWTFADIAYVNSGSYINPAIASDFAFSTITASDGVALTSTTASGGDSYMMSYTGTSAETATE